MSNLAILKIHIRSFGRTKLHKITSINLFSIFNLELENLLQFRDDFLK